MMSDSMNRLPDPQLWETFKEGNKHALQLIYYRHYNLLYGYGLKLTSHPEIAEDCIQELFLKLWRNKSNLGQIISIKSYLFKSYRRILLDLVKLNRKYQNLTDLPTEYDISLSIEQQTVEDEHLTEQRKGLKLALNNLSKRQKEIIYLCYYRGFTYQEITEIIPIKYQTIRNCVYEAIKQLRKNLKKV